MKLLKRLWRVFFPIRFHDLTGIGSAHIQDTLTRRR